jgi:sec-independent protein translocase protein TatC
MTWIEHLEEFRVRLMWALLAVAAGTAISLAFADPLLRLLLKPAGDLRLHALGMLEPFLVKFKVGLTGGFALAMPVLVYQILAYVNPALTARERGVMVPVALAAGILFLAGAVFGYFFIVPPASAWLLSQAGSLIELNITALSYLQYITWFLIGMGLAFQTPLVVVAACTLGIVSPQRLRKEWRAAYMTIVIVSAAVTPDWSPVTMFLLAVPMLVLYEAAVLVSTVIVRRRRQSEADASLALDEGHSAPRGPF